MNTPQAEAQTCSTRVCQPNAGMPLREEISLVLHLSIQEAVLVITTSKGHIGYALRREIETLLLGAHSALV